ncbi:MAG: RNase adapter RapZ [Rhodobiaceae bacterium]|nr:RNase adapter RapZ [Geminicoccaceae bacterium]MCC0014639.1 RNase adapter RapZ [Rhodobiaceae bacterium]
MSDSLLIVTGMSGAGRSSCLKVLEDLDYEAVDNLPLPLLERLLKSSDDLDRRLAIGMDSRTRGFDPAKLVTLVRRLNRTRSFETKLVFFDCDDEVLQQRYTETRRRHPLATDRPVADGIARERSLLGSLREAADIVIDTTRMTLVDLRQNVWGNFAREDDQRMALTVVSFAFRQGLPREADMVLDARFLKNPHYVDRLRPLTGLDKPVQQHILADPVWPSFFASLTALLEPLIPRYRAEGKSYLTIGIGCTGGQHRSVFLTERLAETLRESGLEVMTFHRELSRMGKINNLPASGWAGPEERKHISE